MAITQTISNISQAGHRGVDSRSVFVTKQEAFQDDLTDVFVTEINNVIEQVNFTETNINDKEVSAVSNAEIATTKANEASISASEALASEQLTLQYKNAVELIYDTFDDRFLGSFTSAPATDNDGDPLSNGVMYLNTISNSVYIYSEANSDWIDLAISPTSIGAIDGLLEALTTLTDGVNSKQDTLVSGTSIKTLNGESLLGGGNIVLEAKPTTAFLMAYSI